jgi:folate-binding protein YgfZ
MFTRVTSHFVRLDELPHHDRRLLRLAGADVRRFLQGVLSADVHAVRPLHAAPAALLTVKGKLIAEALVLCGEDEAVALAVPAELAAEVLSLLERHIIMDDVSVHLAEAIRFALVWPDPGTHADGVARYATHHPAPGVLLVGEDAALRAATAGLEPADANGWHLHRIAAATPAWGHEIAADTFPPEVGFVTAVSYDKGCYMGQEPLARIHARGQVNRVMVQLKAPALPPGPTTLAAPDRPQAGRWTSWAVGPHGVVGLAVVHRSCARPGVVLTAEGVGDVEVSSGPLGDDPGVAGKGKPASVQLGGKR